jgi:hypothetical protein
MSKHIIRDSGYGMLGWTEASGSKLYIYNSAGTRLGYYDTDSDKSYKVGGIFIGYGNIISTLL